MIIKCMECDNDVSDKAAACPHCGAPIAIANEKMGLLEEQKALEKKNAFGAFMLAVFLGPIGVMYANLTTGIIMLLVSIALVFLGPVGIGIAWVANCIVATGAADKHNRIIDLKYS